MGRDQNTGPKIKGTRQSVENHGCLRFPSGHVGLRCIEVVGHDELSDTQAARAPCGLRLGFDGS